MRSIADHGFVLSDPSTSHEHQMIERVQKKFLFPQYCSPHIAYTAVTRLFSLIILSDRRKTASIKFNRKLIFGFVDSPVFPADIHFMVPNRRLRNSSPLMVPFCAINCLRNSLVFGVMHLANVGPSFDF